MFGTADERLARRNERAIILQLLRDDHPAEWTLVELEAALDGVEAPALIEALDVLSRQGVVLVPADGRLIASPCARCLDALDLIGI
jgi:hypothetical protein